MFQVRLQTFETNSSSTHTLAIVSPEDWQRFKSDPDLYMDDCGNVMTFQKAVEVWKENYGWEEDEKEPTDDDLAEGHIVKYDMVDNEYYGFKSRELPDGGAAITCYYYD